MEAVCWARSLLLENRTEEGSKASAGVCMLFGVWAFIHEIPHLDTDNNPYLDASWFGSRQARAGSLLIFDCAWVWLGVVVWS
jgi:hypothetical protein